SKRPTSGFAIAETIRAVAASAKAVSVGIPGAGAARSGSFPTGPATPWSLGRRWQVRLEEGPQFPSGMAAAGGFLLIGQRSDSLAVLRPADGAVHASFRLLDEVSQPPLVVGGRLFITSRDGSLQVLSWPGGERLWTRDAADIVGGAPYGRDVVMAVGTALELWSAEGDVLWSTDLGAAAVTAPTLHRGLALVATYDGWLHAARLDLKSTR